MFALGMADNIRGPLFLDLIDYFKLSNTQASLSFASTSGFAFFGNWISGKILKWVSLSSLLIHSLFMMALALILMGIAQNFNLYLFGAAIFGLSMGLLGVAQNLLVAENMDGPHQTKALSGLHGLYGFSSLVAPFAASYAPRLLGPWRSAFYVTGGVAVLVFLFSFVIKPREMIVHQKTFEKGQKVSSYTSLLVFGGILAFYAMAENLISSRLAMYMRIYFDKDLRESSLYVTYFFSFLLLGRALFATKKFSTSLRLQLNILLFLSVVSLLLGLMLHPFFLAVTGLTMAAYYPLGIAYLSEHTHLQKRSYITFALGFQNLCLICMHLGVGYLTDAFGLFYAFGVGLISLVLASVCLNFHPRVVS